MAKTDKKSYFYGTGRRKTSVARVRLMPGTGEIIVNGIPYEERFPRPAHRRAITNPLLVTENLGKYNTVVKVEGGGITGQSGAIRKATSKPSPQIGIGFSETRNGVRHLASGGMPNGP